MNLLEVLRDTHKKAARRNNASTQVLIAAWESNGHQLIPAITAAMQTFGGRHAPIKNTYELLRSLVRCGKDISHELYLRYNVEDKPIVPGFGSSFHKGHADPLLDQLELYLNNEWAIVWSKIRNYLLNRGRNLYPNLAFYTAAVCIEEGININFCEAEMLKARIEEWILILQERSNNDTKIDKPN